MAKNAETKGNTQRNLITEKLAYIELSFFAEVKMIIER